MSSIRSKEEHLRIKCKDCSMRCHGFNWNGYLYMYLVTSLLVMIIALFMTLLASL